MLLLVTTAHPSIHEHGDPDTGAAVHELLGRLLTPRHYSSVEKTAAEGIPWACDNDGFGGVDEAAFQKMLDRVAGLPGCRFVTAPDVVRCSLCSRTKDGYGGGARCVCSKQQVKNALACREIDDPVFGDAALTAQRFAEWKDRIAATGQPVALVLQDGQDEVGIDWDGVDAVFVGGTTAFKLGDEAARWVREAKARGCWVHWGRVSSRKRMRHCVGTGAADSCDGTKFAMFRDAHLDNGLRWSREVGEAVMPALVAA